jgi:hypothetical protein
MSRVIFLPILSLSGYNLGDKIVAIIAHRAFGSEQSDLNISLTIVN